MAADSRMGFQQGITSSLYNQHILSFQSKSEASSGAGGADGMFMAPASISTGMFLAPNTGVFGNPWLVGPSRSSSGDAFRGSVAPKYNFVTGSPSDWSDRELNILKEGLMRFAGEPNIMKYTKIAAMLPNRTIRDVARRCWWVAPTQDRMVASSSMANLHVAPTNNMAPLSISVQHPNQQWQVREEGFPTGSVQNFASPVEDNAIHQLLEENDHVLNQITANIESFKIEENTGLFLRMNNNIKTILRRMSEEPGFMGVMPPLPELVNEQQLNPLLQLARIVPFYDAVSATHMKQEPRS